MWKSCDRCDEEIAQMHRRCGTAVKHRRDAIGGLEEGRSMWEQWHTQRLDYDYDGTTTGGRRHLMNVQIIADLRTLGWPRGTVASATGTDSRQ